MKTKRSALAFFFAAAMCCLVSCNNDDPTPKGDYKSRSIDLNENEKTVSAYNSQFDWRFFEQYLAECDINTNCVLSPLSANICFSMLANATARNSQEELIKALGFEGLSMEDINSYSQKVTEQLCSLDPNVKVSMANSFWYAPALEPKSEFIKNMKKYYDMDAFTINPSSFVNDVNSWCNKKTNGLIPKILYPQEVKDFALLNALYFKGNWHCDYTFIKSNTFKDKFTNADGSESQIDFMNATKEYETYYAHNWTGASIPFGGRGFKFTVILPDEGYTIDDALASLKECDLSQTQRKFSMLNLKLPKFKMTSKADLINTLQAMGVNDIFTDNADFSNLTEEHTLIVDLIRQNVSFEINEEGAEAAAVTIVGGYETTIIPSSDMPQDFFVDRPFIYMISEESSGAILFIGCIKKF